ncbi:AraC family transcriptional regulator [Flavobacterium sp. HXWNR70]|uniref:AraC family transcriptional regulator n=2 Tax=Flavobacterium luminosum TaxID=2949086 RepID=A0ABT0TQT5_9FLAO|nr:AraC family transcriptional regulator [Flavobacterium sp. HXWNR70]
MASGNFSHRIARTEEDDELESLTVLINMVAEEMQETLFPKGYINTHHLQQNLISLSFIVDEDFIIRSTIPETYFLLNYKTTLLEGQEFAKLLTDTSAQNFYKLLPTILANEKVSTLSLSYLTSDQKEVVSLFSSISRISNENRFIIHSILVDSAENENHQEDFDSAIRLPKTRRDDAKLMQLLYDYILSNLENPLPSLKELSKIFGTNEHKLKESFKYFFNTSIYQFYNDERLKRVHLLIEQTNIPLKSVAYMNGFNTYPNFSKAFKKKYGYSPNDLKRGNDSL